MEISADIVDYMGKYQGGVIVLLSVGCDGDFTEGTVFYTDKDIVLTLDPSIENKLGMPIYQWDGYKDLLTSIFNRLVPANQMIGRLDDFEIDDVLPDERTNIYVEGEIDPSNIIVATQSNL